MACLLVARYSVGETLCSVFHNVKALVLSLFPENPDNLRLSGPLIAASPTNARTFSLRCTIPGTPSCKGMWLL
jgi:hypothetical protein